MNPTTIARRSRWAGVVIAIGLLAGAIFAAREPILRAAGHALVAADPVAAADIIVISLDAGAAGALEAADLVQQGIAAQVAVFVDPPTNADHEFVRRGLPYEDEAARQERQLASLGVTNVLRIPRTDAGSEGEGQVLPAWAAEHRFTSIVVVTTTDHSRRLRRVLARALRDHDGSITIRPSRYSSFEPDHWWESRSGTRIGLVELEKLALDYVLHPMTTTSEPAR